MKTKSLSHPLKTAIAAALGTLLVGTAVGAQAAAEIIAIGLAPGSLGGTLDDVVIDNDNNTIDLSKTFTSLDPIVLRFTVGHAAGGGGNSFDVTEAIANDTGIAWNDFHFSFVEADPGVVFGSFNSSTLDGFALDSPPNSGPGNLNFTGFLADIDTTHAIFSLNLSDPGNGNTYSFDLVQQPTVVPIPAAAWMLGSALAGLVGFRRRSA